jgi:hypothetical protein
MRHFILIIGLCFLHFYSLGQYIDRLNKKELKNLITLLKYSRDSISFLKLKSDENILNLKSEINKINQQAELLTKINNDNYELNNQLKNRLEIYSDSIYILNGKLQLKDSVISNINTTKNIIESYNHSNMFANIQNERIANTLNGKIRLHEFELYAIMIFKNCTGLGMFGTLQFIIEDSNKLIEFNSEQNKYEENGTYDKNYNWTGNSVIIELERWNDILKRNVIKGNKYQVIFSYQSDSKSLRNDLPIEHDSGYYIVDIVGLKDKFSENRYN